HRHGEYLDLVTGGQHGAGTTEHRPQRSNWRLVRKLRWPALVATIAAIAALVPPLVAPRARHRTSATPSPSAVPTPSPAAASFARTTVHAADPATVLVGARVIGCRTCDGGRRVGYIGGPNVLLIRVTGVAVPGDRTLVVTYESDGPRTLKIAVNGALAGT